MAAPAAISLVSCQGVSGLASSQRSTLLPTELPARRIGSGFQHAWAKQPSPVSLSLSAVTRAVALNSDQVGAPQPVEKDKPTRYYFLVANAKFLLDEEEHFREQLDERLRHLGERGREQNFWLVPEPKFLQRFPGITRRLGRPAVALVSTDEHWMRFMKLRLDRVLTESFDAPTLQDALAANPVHLRFPEPKTWTAPYPKYEYGWWEPFLPPKA